jgi:hypothetical protein
VQREDAHHRCSNRAQLHAQHAHSGRVRGWGRQQQTGLGEPPCRACRPQLLGSLECQACSPTWITVAATIVPEKPAQVTSTVCSSSTPGSAASPYTSRRPSMWPARLLSSQPAPANSPMLTLTDTQR